MKAIKLTIYNFNFVSFTFDEATTAYNASWANVKDWCLIPLLLDVYQMLSIYGVDSLILLIMNSLMTQGDLKQENIVVKVVCFDVDGVNTF